jgi:hypothetical protein
MAVGWTVTRQPTDHALVFHASGAGVAGRLFPTGGTTALCFHLADLPGHLVRVLLPRRSETAETTTNAGPSVGDQHPLNLHDCTTGTAARTVAVRDWLRRRARAFAAFRLRCSTSRVTMYRFPFTS